MQKWQEDRINFYNKSNAFPFIKEYFDVKDGVRCIVAHPIEYIKNGKRIQYDYDPYNNTQKMYTLYPEVLIKYNCIHSFMYIFDKIVLEWIDQDDSLDLYRSAEYSGRAAAGINAILEIDSPYESLEKGAKRLDIIDCIPELNSVINKIDKILEDRGEDYIILFSGNGIYIILEGYYPRLDNNLGNLVTYKENFVNLFDSLKLTELCSDLRIHIDNKSAPWNDYMKIPFTFHEKLPRISIPLPKEEIIKEDLEYYSSVQNVMNDYSLIDKIISKAKWEKLW